MEFGLTYRWPGTAQVAQLMQLMELMDAQQQSQAPLIDLISWWWYESCGICRLLLVVNGCCWLVLLFLSRFSGLTSRISHTRHAHAQSRPFLATGLVAHWTPVRRLVDLVTKIRWVFSNKTWFLFWIFSRLFLFFHSFFQMGVSINGGTPKWLVYNGKCH